MDPSYRINPHPVPYNATQSADHPWQRRVYGLAATRAADLGLKSVLDVGCGEGGKLIEFLGHLPTCGIEIEPTLSYLKGRYPDRVWRQPGESYLGHDLVVCADVIEHVDNPDELLDVIKKARPKLVVISTPERSLIPGADQLGPPRNPSHIREWNFEEFGKYMDSHFDVLEHIIIDHEQYAQCVVARPY